MLLPSGMYVQGVIDRVERAGHVKGNAQVDMHFTSMIFPNGTLVEIPGVVEQRSRSNEAEDDGRRRRHGRAGQRQTRNLGKAAEIALPAGTTVGAIGGASSGHLGAGIGAGLGGGLAAMALATVFTRGADVNLEAGTQVEMVLQRPLVLEEDNLTGGTGQGAAPALVPAANQQKAMEKPNRARVMCPLGGLDCR